MRNVTCYDCGKKYDYDVDDFCPRCGAYTRPDRQVGIEARGNVVRVDGINEANHKGSFVHAELHKENRKRRGSPLEQDGGKTLRRASTKKPAAAEVQIAQPLQGHGKPAGKQAGGLSPFWSILAVILLSILSKIF